MSNILKTNLKREGFAIAKNIVSDDFINRVKEEVSNIFSFQYDHLYKNNKPMNNTDELITFLYNNNRDAFLACSKQAQKIPLIHNLASSEKIIDLLSKINLNKPTISYTPLLMFNSKIMNKYITPPHQDWRSMQGSLDSVVVWIPLQDVYDGFGNIELVPKSHKKGLVSTKSDDWFRKIEDKDYDNKFSSIKISKGDALIFSTFLIHRTGINNHKNIRWSLQFRYNNLSEETYIQRGFPDPYKHFPVEDLITKNFPTIEKIEEIFNESK